VKHTERQRQDDGVPIVSEGKLPADRDGFAIGQMLREPAGERIHPRTDAACREREREGRKEGESENKLVSQTGNTSTERERER
jgi:hypothetical protein